MQENTIYTAGLYLRLSKDDERQGESISISTQRAILTDYCLKHQYSIHKEYIDDGYSGMNFERPGFRELLEDVERGMINMVITKDLSRLGRDYIMTGYYSEIFFETKGVRYIALADDVDSLKGFNQIAPFKNILNDMYAQDISQKVKTAKHQRAKEGLFIGAQAPFGYCKNPDNHNQLIVDPDAAEVVKTIFALAEQGMGNVAIASTLKERKIITPAAYKYQRGDGRFVRYSSVKDGNTYDWCYGTIGQILRNPVYTGQLVSLKTETINCKLKKRATVPEANRIVISDAHEAIISLEQFDIIQQIRRTHFCPANLGRDNLFRGKLFCDCCGHPLALSSKQLAHGRSNLYTCTYHYRHADICPQTHQIYHDVLYAYVLQQVRIFAKSMKRRKIKAQISNYPAIDELTPEILDTTIERIEVGHLTRKTKPGCVVHIYWKFR